MTVTLASTTALQRLYHVLRRRFPLLSNLAAAMTISPQALVSELKEELLRLVGSTKKTQKVENAPGMEVRKKRNPAFAADCVHCFRNNVRSGPNIPEEQPPHAKLHLSRF